MSGLGIAQTSTAICNSELRSGRLLALLTDYALEPVEVHAVLPGGPRASAKVLAFTDFAAAFKAVPHVSAQNGWPRRVDRLPVDLMRAGTDNNWTEGRNARQSKHGGADPYPEELLPITRC
jgi:hypothetical protein